MGACACCITIFSPPQYDIPLPETHNYTYNTDLWEIVKLDSVPDCVGGLRGRRRLTKTGNSTMV